MNLCYMDWDNQLKKMNMMVDEYNEIAMGMGIGSI